MGISSSSQFLGAFFGGALGGMLLNQSSMLAWGLLGGIMAVALLLIMPIAQPPYLSSTTMAIPKSADIKQWSQQVMAIEGVDDVVVMPKNGVAYLKLDKQVLSDNSRQLLSQLTDTKLDI